MGGLDGEAEQDGADVLRDSVRRQGQDAPERWRRGLGEDPFSPGAEREPALR